MTPASAAPRPDSGLPPQPRDGAGRSRKERLCVFAALLAAVAGLACVSRCNYLLFHSLAEVYHVAVCWGIFFVAWSARRLFRNSYLCILGVASFFVGFLYLLHMLAYKGMGVFPDAGANLPTQLWIAARLLQALAFFAASLSLFQPRREINALAPAAIWGLLTLLLAGLIFNGYFPDCFVAGQGLTLFKKLTEIGAALLLLFSGLLAWLRRDRLDRQVLTLLLASLLLTSAAGLMFILYTKVNGPANMLGHLFNVGSTYCVFRAFIRTGVTAPQRLLFLELHRRQEELELIRSGLEREVRERTAHLNKKNSELEASNQRLDEFAYSVSHDLREPLRGIYNFAHFLSEDCRDKIPADSQEMLDTIMRLAKRLDTQILAVLKYSRIGRLELDLRPVSLDRLLDEALDSLADMIALRKGRVERPRPLPETVCHGDHVREVFHNLISNGLMYNDQDEKIITVGWHPPGAAAEDVPLSGGAAPVFFVRDNGIGIPEKHFQKIFGIFRRLHGQDKYGGGTGVGLTIAKQVIERHGGRITLRSKPGSGTTFYFTLSAGEQ
jgi:signal transduction histidine kinase